MQFDANKSQTYAKEQTNFVNCNKTIDKLNKILFQQQLIKSNKQLSNKMIEELQRIEPKYVLLKSNLTSGGVDENFKLINNILYKTEKIFDQMSYKLCLPSFVAQDILTNEHLRHNQHLSIKPLTDRFNSLFYVPDIHKKATKVIETCLSCLLASTSYKKKISGTSRTHEDDTVVGRNYVADIAYLPPSRPGNRFCLVLVE